ncbi:glutamyl-tRNA amidotransferase subunit A [Penicillium crustosum]|uniref:glutamyl-tRNA amidotransferase subunit A n=1 Tax=Penicillium crustosum TaxID=36656 RepID=UPI00238EFBE3|nr:glutamyl-tRNA amidotransferase subunit A [Penicillium crustosum]KAJ5396215.1 glutamyl-tRNA amidotransferase subunit A [Penicillium crustosum]
MEKYNVDLFAVLSDWGIANDIAAKVEFPVMSVTLGYLPEETPVEHAQSLSFKRPDCHML